MRKCFLTISFVFTGILAFAQENIDHEFEYERARELFNEGRYGLAGDRFKLLTQEDRRNPYAAYASYYFALCSYHQGYLSVARDMLLQIRNKYPNWSRTSAVQYWLSLIYFEQDEPAKAIATILTIDDEAVTLQAEQMERFYLRKIESLDTIQNLLQRYPYSLPLAEQTAYLISQQDFLSRDLDLFDSLVGAYGLPVEGDSLGQLHGFGPKDQYEIGLMLPFLASDLEPNLTRKVNQFVLDLYQGMLLAADSLEETGGRLNFTLYDTQRDTAVVSELLNDNRLRRSDLIIGPLYNPEQIAEFSKTNKVNVVHPYSEDPELVTDNPFYFLYSSQPSLVANKAAELVKADTTKQTGIVFYGENAADSIMARTFLDSLDSTHFNPVIIQRINEGEEREGLRVLTSGVVVNELELEELAIGPDSIDLVFVASTGRGGSVYSNIITGIEARGDTIPILGTHNWLEDDVVNKDYFRNLEITMTAYEFIDYTDSAFMRFSDRYLEKYGILPSKFASIGYDMMLFFGSMLQKHGKYFQRGLRDSGFIPGTLSWGFDYSNSNSNAAIPVIRWDGKKITVVDSLPVRYKEPDENAGEGDDDNREK